MAKIPYKCKECGAENCKLWREYNVVASHNDLRCCPCALKAEGRQGPVGQDGRLMSEYGLTDQIGGLIPAAPTDDGETFWGYTSVPDDRVKWWKDLPTYPEVRHGR